MKTVIGRACYGFHKEDRLPFAVRLEIHQEDCPHIDDPAISEEELLDHVACLALGKDEDYYRCPYSLQIDINEDGGYTCQCEDK